MLFHTGISLKAIIEKDSSVMRQLSSTDVVRAPDNYTMNSTNFQMAIRPYFQVSKHLDFERYFRVVYGPEWYVWKGESIEITYENNLGVICERNMF